MLLRPAVPADIPGVVALERLPAAVNFVGQWSEARHHATLADPDARYLVSGSESGGLQAYAILRGLGEGSGSLELKRVVVGAPGQGLGRLFLEELLRMAFEEFGAHRLFLDVVEDNDRASRLYESLGFVREGTMREAERRRDGYVSLHLMSMLDREYAAWRFTRSQPRPSL